jgi:hypothetical protein
MVPEGRRYATPTVWALSEAALRPVSLVCGARGDRAPARARLLHAGGRSSTWAGSIDDLPGVAAQRCHPKRQFGISCNDSAMACRASRSPSEAGKAGAKRDIAGVCVRTTGWRRRRSERCSRSRSDRVLERPSTWPPAGEAVGTRMEPGADRPSSAGRFSGR